MSDSNTKKRNRRIVIGVLAAVASAAAIAPMAMGLLTAHEVGRESDLPVLTTTSAPSCQT
jgi:hypothetical protein